MSSLLDVWVQPVTMWVRAWPQRLHKALPVLPHAGEKGRFFWLVSLILKECGIPSDLVRLPNNIALLSSTGWTEAIPTITCRSGHVEGQNCAQFLRRMWGRWVKEHQRRPSCLRSIAWQHISGAVWGDKYTLLQLVFRRQYQRWLSLKFYHSAHSEKKKNTYGEFCNLNGSLACSRGTA